MPKMKMLLPVLAVAAVLTGCGGGGGSKAFANPDDTLLLVVSEAGSPEIRMVDLATGAQARLTNTVGATYPDISRDGSKIVFVRNGNIFSVNKFGGNLTQLTFDGQNIQPAWSPDGTKITYISYSSERDVMQMNADGSGVTQLTDDTNQNENPSYSPDGSKVIFAVRSGSNRGVYEVNVSSLAITTLYQNPNLILVNEPEYSPDGTRISFYRWLTGGSEEVVTMNLDGTNETVINNIVNGLGITWGKTGRIVFWSLAGNTRSVFVTDVNQMNPTVIATFEGGSMQPALP